MRQLVLQCVEFDLFQAEIIQPQSWYAGQGVPAFILAGAVAIHHSIPLRPVSDIQFRAIPGGMMCSRLSAHANGAIGWQRFSLPILNCVIYIFLEKSIIG